MGTNYYLLENVCPCCGRGDERLHIGKSSAEPGPYGLARHALYPGHCIGHGAGTWDLLIGEFSDTFRELKRDAIQAYNQKWPTSLDPDAEYQSDRKEYGVQVVRCTITTEPVKP